ncbi:hypothetical protein D915_004944 [Fasciola hepatica]|uniref:Phosphatidylinositol N-acetylglucosaminyltransferase subunit Q n=1 Tax=Fasciola hepatica TaxID=6192 RepID=A0A4E0R6Y9_FASHE|nr:hypothetical protein D915_004944 [Fasciola hepatica]
MLNSVVTDRSPSGQKTLPHIVLVFSIVKSCESNPVNSVDVVSQIARDNGLSVGRLTGTVRCLFSDCRNSKSTPELDCDCVTRSALLSSLWIEFRCDVLVRLRRFHFAAMLDQQMASGSKTGTNHEIDNSPDWDQLVRSERTILIDCLGPYLTTLTLNLTDFPVDLKHLRGVEQGAFFNTDAFKLRLNFLATLCNPVTCITRRLVRSSHTLSLLRFHLQHDGYSLRLRGLIPGSLNPGNELFGIPRTLLTWIVHGAYKIRATGSSADATHHARPIPCPVTANATLTLLSALQILFLLLSLLTPLHLVRSPVTLTPVVGKTSEQDNCTGFLSSYFQIDLPTKSGWPDWMIINEIDCTRVPTFGWFFVNTSETGGFVMPSDPPPVLSPLELKRNQSVGSRAPCGFFATWNEWIEFTTCELTRLLIWLESGEPAGLKINLHLARLMGHFFLYHILAWRTYCGFLIHMAGLAVSVVQYFTEVQSVDTVFCASLVTSACLMLGTLHVTCTHPSAARCVSSWAVFITYVSTVLRLTGALILCLLLDLINLLALHLTTFYVYTIHLLKLQCRTIGAAWRLCRSGSKWNPLRSRVDTVPDMYVGPKIFALTRSRPGRKHIHTRMTVPDSGEYDVHLDRLFVATLLGLGVSLCLLPTTLAFYVVFSAVRLFIVLVRNGLRVCALFILDVPVSALFAWLLHSDLSRTELAMVVPPLAPTSFPLTRLKLIRPPLTKAYEENRFLQNRELFGTCFSLSSLIRRLLTASEI